jgi:hypothetical protein
MNIITQLNNKLPFINNKIPHINEGGCGIFASILGEKLTRMGYNPKYFILTKVNDKLNNTQTKKFTLDEIHEKIPPYHIVVVLKGYYIDSRGCIKNGHWYCNGDRLKKGMEMSLEQLKEYVKNETYWNNVFNRKKIPKIIKSIENLDKEPRNYFKNILKLIK